MNKKSVCLVLHRRIEAGAEDEFDVVKAFDDYDKAEAYCDMLSEKIDCEYNDDNDVDEEYWVKELDIE